MENYLLTFFKTIPLDKNVRSSVIWQTTISANGEIHAKQEAVKIGSMIRQKLAKGYDIELDSVEEVVSPPEEER
jgi:hypothetical protein